MSAKTKLFQAYIKHNKDAAAIPGLANGIEILQNDLNHECPSNLYAYSMSGLISSK